MLDEFNEELAAEAELVGYELPEPFTLNSMFRNVKGIGRAKTSQYKVWRESADWMLCAQKRCKVHGPVALAFRVPRTSATMDLDNTLKAYIDALVRCECIDDDRNVAEISAKYCTDARGSVVIVPAEKVGVVRNG